MRFTKMHGLGNDFIVFDGSDRPDLSVDDRVRLCERRRGVGADGVIIVTPVDDATIRMEYWNADGSPAEMCGNGLRCAAWYAHERTWVTAPRFTVETARGPLVARVLGHERVRVEMGPVTVGDPVWVAGAEVVTASVGNPHAVLDVDSVARAPVSELGPALAGDPAFPEGANIGFMAVTGAGIDLRVWERGVGETLACGSGAVAAAAVAIETGRTSSPVAVHLPGGVLVVEIDGGRARITGDVATVYEGDWPG